MAFTNDGGSRDVQVDYIIVNGETRQSENQSSNTGLYANGSCGGGWNSEWMHCNGAIAYGPVANSANSIVVRARGTAGTESVSLRIDNTNVATWTMTTSLQNYSASTNLNGSITVAFTNDATGRDVQVDYIVVNGTDAPGRGAKQQHRALCERQLRRRRLQRMDALQRRHRLRNRERRWRRRRAAPRIFRRQHHDQRPTSARISSSTGIRSRRRTRASGARSNRPATCTTGAGWTARTTTRSQNNIPFKQHTFIWGAQAPGWINSLSASEQAAEIEEWIRDFCARYPKTAMIDVVNEAIPSHQPAAFARNAFGNNWIIRSFQLARQYCPNAILILNDYNVLSWDTDAFIQLATPVVAAGVVDALGEQAHGLESWSVADIQSRLNRVAALGLPIYITEYDVARTNDQEQLNIMQAQFPLFHDHPSVAGITLWGYVVGSTWVNGSGLIQSNGTPRPAMTWLMNYLGR